MESEMIRWLQSVNSTNDIARISLNVPNGYCVASDEQSKGRGQRGNVWVSEKSLNILASFLFAIPLKISHSFVVSMLTSLAIVKFLAKYNCKAQIKWPNDIIVNNKKIAGILIENDLLGEELERSIIGVGLNVNQLDFSSIPNAISLSHVTGLQYDVRSMVVKLQQFFIAEFGQTFILDKIKDEYMANLYAADRALYRTQEFDEYAVVFDVGFDGALSLMFNNGEIRSYYFKEIEMIY